MAGREWVGGSRTAPTGGEGGSGVVRKAVGREWAPLSRGVGKRRKFDVAGGEILGLRRGTGNHKGCPYE